VWRIYILHFQGVRLFAPCVIELNSKILSR
jgi:hypothetical protein